MPVVLNGSGMLLMAGVRIEWSDEGFVVGCVSRSSLGVFRAMVGCGDFGWQDCGCGLDWRGVGDRDSLDWRGDRGRDIFWGREALFGLITLFGLIDDDCAGKYGIENVGSEKVSGEYGSGEWIFVIRVLILEDDLTLEGSLLFVTSCWV